MEDSNEQEVNDEQKQYFEALVSRTIQGDKLKDVLKVKDSAFNQYLNVIADRAQKALLDLVNADAGDPVAIIKLQGDVKRHFETLNYINRVLIDAGLAEEQLLENRASIFDIEDNPPMSD
ncbi:MAG: hypothetical protein GY952_14140 [Rhodobacteraceae bacterium]|nr:hypothetical protein [Paracoccaceae bacterium]